MAKGATTLPLEAPATKDSVAETRVDPSAGDSGVRPSGAEVLEGAARPSDSNQALAPVDSFTSMIERLATNPAVDVDKLQRLLDMQERILNRNAESAFNAAFADMSAEIPTVMEKGRTDKATYAQLEDIVEAVRPILRKHGFAVSHKTEWPDKGTVKVIGILTHREGHSRTSEFLSSADASGSKNAIQGLGSAVAYGRRYTTKDLLNIVTRHEDDDGASSEKGKQPESPAGYDAWLAVIEGLASSGLPALTDAWNKSKPEHRNFLMKWAPHRWATAKATAGKVKP